VPASENTDKHEVTMLELRKIGEDLPDGFDGLLSDSIRDGHRFLQWLHVEWHSGANRFSGPGERLIAVFENDRLIAIGGINVDPYASDKSTGRIRHLYVHTSWRRRGVASAILNDLERKASGHFKTLTLRTDNPAASLFYQASGFRVTQNRDFVTHEKLLR
jgi:GNAT superfamily N-acetyltransferase